MKKWNLLILVLLFVLALAACGGGADPAPETTDSTTDTSETADTADTSEEVEEPADGEPIAISVWNHAGQGGERDAINTIATGFNSSQSDYVVEIVELPDGSYTDQVNAAALANDLPCLLDFDGPLLYNFAWSGFLQPITPYADQALLDDFLPSIINQGTYNGELYSLGQFDSGLAIYANKAYLEEAGVRIPTSIDDAWTLEEFEAALAALQELDQVEYAMDMHFNYGRGEWYTYGFSPILQGFGGDLIDRSDYQAATGTLDGAESVAAMTALQSWVDAGYVNPGQTTDDDFYGSKISALAWVGHWMYNTHKDELGDDSILIPMPDFGGGAATGMGSWNWGITSGCENPDGAWAFLEYMIQPDNILIMTDANGAVPARFSALEQREELFGEGGDLNIFIQQLNSDVAVPRPITPAYATITSEFSFAIDSIVTGGDVQSVLSDAAFNIDLDIEDNNGYAGADVVADEPAAEAEPAGDPIAISVWNHAGQGGERDAINTIATGFNSSQSEYVVELVELPDGSYTDQVNAAALANDLPCLLDFDGPLLYNFAWSGFLQPITPYTDQALLDDFLPSIINQGTYNGELYSLGQFDSGLAIYANKAYLEEAGVRIPTGIDDAWTLEEFEAALAALQELPQVEYAMDMHFNYGRGEWYTYGFSPILQGFGGDLIDRSDYQSASGTLDGAESVAAMTALQSWIDAGYVNPGQTTDDDFYGSQISALAWVGHWMYNTHKDELGDDSILVPMPDFGGGAATGMGSWNWGITSGCENPDGAWAFLEYMIQPDNILIMTDANGAVPARFSALEQREELFGEGGDLNIFIQQLNSDVAVPRPITPAYATITSEFSFAIDSIVTGGDVQSVLSDAAFNIDLDIEDNNGYE